MDLTPFSGHCNNANHAVCNHLRAYPVQVIHLQYFIPCGERKVPQNETIEEFLSRVPVSAVGDSLVRRGVVSEMFRYYLNFQFQQYLYERDEIGDFVNIRQAIEKNLDLWLFYKMIYEMSCDNCVAWRFCKERADLFHNRCQLGVRVTNPAIVRFKNNGCPNLEVYRTLRFQLQGNFYTCRVEGAQPVRYIEEEGEREEVYYAEEKHQQHEAQPIHGSVSIDVRDVNPSAENNFYSLDAPQIPLPSTDRHENNNVRYMNRPSEAEIVNDFFRSDIDHIPPLSLLPNL